MNIWIVIAFNTNNYPTTRIWEGEAIDFNVAVSQSNFMRSEIVCVKLKGL